MTAWRAARSVGAVGGGEQRQRLGVVLDLAADRDEDRLVGLDRADDVVAGDVGGGDDDDRRPVERRVEVEGDERACASVERIVAPYQAPGKTRSSAYLAAPVSLAGPSRRSGAAPRARPGAIVPGSIDDGAGAARSGSSARARAILHGD